MSEMITAGVLSERMDRRCVAAFIRLNFSNLSSGDWSVRLILIVSLTAIFFPPAVQAERASHLRVLCYNIHYGQGTDGRYDLDRLAGVIRETQPDLVALQEVDVGVSRSSRVHEARELGRLTGMAVRFGPTQHYQGGLYGNAVLSRLPIEDVLIQPLPYSESDTVRTTYPRGAIAVTVRLPNQQLIRFISTHFQHNVPEDRVAEAKAVCRYFAGEKQVPSILAGDMNAKPDSEPIAILEKHWLHASDSSFSPTAPAGAPTTRIDYIFYQRRTNLKLIESRVIDESVASDHRPVLAVFEFGGKED